MYAILIIFVSFFMWVLCSFFILAGSWCHCTTMQRLDQNQPSFLCIISFMKKRRKGLKSSLENVFPYIAKANRLQQELALTFWDKCPDTYEKLALAWRQDQISFDILRRKKSLGRIPSGMDEVRSVQMEVFGSICLACSLLWNHHHNFLLSALSIPPLLLASF